VTPEWEDLNVDHVQDMSHSVAAIQFNAVGRSLQG